MDVVDWSNIGWYCDGDAELVGEIPGRIMSGLVSAGEGGATIGTDLRLSGALSMFATRPKREWCSGAW